MSNPRELQMSIEEYLDNLLQPIQQNRRVIQNLRVINEILGYLQIEIKEIMESKKMVLQEILKKHQQPSDQYFIDRLLNFFLISDPKRQVFIEALRTVLNEIKSRRAFVMEIHTLFLVYDFLKDAPLLT